MKFLEEMQRQGARREKRDSGSREKLARTVTYVRYAAGRVYSYLRIREQYTSGAEPRLV